MDKAFALHYQALKDSIHFFGKERCIKHFL